MLIPGLFMPRPQAPEDSLMWGVTTKDEHIQIQTIQEPLQGDYMVYYSEGGILLIYFSQSGLEKVG